MDLALTPNNNELIRSDEILSGFSKLIKMVTDGLTSEHSRRAYEKALHEFMNWYIEKGAPELKKAVVQEYKKYLQDLKLSHATINQRLSAVRKFVQEAGDNQLIDEQRVNSIMRVKGIKKKGIRSGNWITPEEAEKLINAPDETTLRGKRDRAILAVFIYGWLRRSELAALTMEHIQQREGVWAIVDMVGKGDKPRTFGLSPIAKVLIDEWTKAAGISEGRIFRAIDLNDQITGVRESAGRNKDGEKIDSDGFITDQAIADVVKKYGNKCGMPKLAAHDLRRTGARLAYDAGATVEQIQLQLGHADPKTTHNYLNLSLNLHDAPGDKIKLKIRMPEPAA